MAGFPFPARDNHGYPAELGYGPRLGSAAPPSSSKLVDSEVLVTHFPQGVERLARDLKGRFQSLNQQIKMAFEAAAKDLQEEEVKALRQGLRRPQGAQAGRPEENLVKALLSERNRKVTQDGLAVNLVEWLNSPASKVNLYWRGLEDGTSKHVGQIIYGFFLGVDKNPHAASQERRFLDPRMVVGHSSIEFREGGAHGIKGASRIKKAQEVAGFFRIKNRIEAVHFITKGTQIWEASGSLQRHTEAAISAAGLRANKADK